jgi:hypothetical protein
MTTTAYDKAIERLEGAVKHLGDVSDSLMGASLKFFHAHADKAPYRGYILKLAFVDLNGLAMDTFSHSTRQKFMLIEIKNGLSEIYNAENVSGILELAGEIHKEANQREYDWNNKVAKWGKKLTA